MTPERWQQVKQVAADAAALPREARAAWLDVHCADDPALRDEVESLLAQDEDAAGLLTSPIGFAVQALAREPGPSADPGDEPASLPRATVLVSRYRVDHSIGAGGMGEVYEARDQVLERSVAIKVLPAWLAASAERQERFAREARNLARLSHPHICAIHDAGVHGGMPFIVMELLAGETLAARLARGPLGTSEAIDLGIQVAEALAYAHRQGVVHRDLKPGNVMMLAGPARAEQPQVKLLDFGLAKVRAPRRSDEATATARRRSDSLSLTATGDIIGTVHYMAPEQLEGQSVDARTDVFALGILLYEMVSGARPFTGSSRASIVASILRDRPLPLAARAVVAPPALDRVIGACLSKSPDERWQSAQDVATALRAISTTDEPRTREEPEPARVSSPGWGRYAAAAALVVGLGALAGWGIWMRLPQVTSAPGPTLRVGLSLPGDALGPYWGPALSPDGRHVAFVAAMPGGPARIWLRSLDASTSRALPGTDGALRLFWAPGSDHLAFLAEGELRRVSLSGSVERIASVPSALWGGTWNASNTILLSRGPGGGLYAIPAHGGEPRDVMEPDVPRGEQGLLWPAFLPDGQTFLYTVESSNADVRGIYLASLQDRRGTRLTGAWSPAAYASEGYLVYARDQTLVAHEFDARQRRLVGEPVALGERATGARWGFFSAAPGVVAFLSAPSRTRLVWLDRTGRDVGRLGDEGAIGGPVVSPDGRHVAVHKADSETGADDVWVFDKDRGTSIRLTTGRESDSDPVWSPDSRSVAFSKDGLGLYEKPASGSGDLRLLLRAKGGEIYPNDWSPDNAMLVYIGFLGELGGPLVAAAGASRRARPVPPDALHRAPGAVCSRQSLDCLHLGRIRPGRGVRPGRAPVNGAVRRVNGGRRTAHVAFGREGTVLPGPGRDAVLGGRGCRRGAAGVRHAAVAVQGAHGADLDPERTERLRGDARRVAIPREPADVRSRAGVQPGVQLVGEASGLRAMNAASPGASPGRPAAGRAHVTVVRGWVAALLVAHLHLLAIVDPAEAQAVHGGVGGTVTDTTGAILPGVTITFVDALRKVTETAVTDGSGWYSRTHLLPGVYEVMAELPGFRSAVVRDVVVRVDTQVPLNFVMALGDFREVVGVTGGAPLLKVDRADVATAFDTREVSDLPILDRNLTRLVMFTPGALRFIWQHPASENPQGSMLTQINGQPFGGTGYQLDGVENREPILGVIVINPSLEAIEEAKITSQNYDAEFGQATAGVVSVRTRSGSNDVRGSLFAFYQGDQFQARNPFTQFQPDPLTGRMIPESDRHQFGGSLGGPLIANRRVLLR